MEREIALLQELNHNNVMKLIEVLFIVISILMIFILNLIKVFINEEKGKIYMVLEYCCAVLKDMLDQVLLVTFS